MHLYDEKNMKTNESTSRKCPPKLRNYKTLLYYGVTEEHNPRNQSRTTQDRANRKMLCCFLSSCCLLGTQGQDKPEAQGEE